MNYFERTGFSNSLSKRVEAFVKYDIPRERWSENIKVPDSDAITIGTNIDELLSDEIKSENIICLDEYLKGFNNTELAIIEKGKTMNPYDAYVSEYNNEQIRLSQSYLSKYNKGEYPLAKETNAHSALILKIDELFNKAEPYYTAFNNSEGKRIVSQEVYTKVMKCYDALRTNVEYNTLFESSGIFDTTQVFKQFEHYWTIPVTIEGHTRNLKCKAKIDLLKIDYDNKIVYIGDLKSHSQPLEKTIKNKKYIRQLSYYSEAVRDFLNDDSFIFRYFIVGVHTEYYAVKILEIHKWAILHSKVGGYYKPEFFTQYEESKYNPYMDGVQIEIMARDYIWENVDTAYSEFWIYGWEQLIYKFVEIYNNNGDYLE